MRSFVTLLFVTACSFRAGGVAATGDGPVPGDGPHADAHRNDAAHHDALDAFVPDASIPPKHIQNGVAEVGVATSVSVTFTKAVTAGDFLVCYCRAGSSYTNVTVTDNVNGAWSLVDGTGASAMFFRANSAAAAANALTITVANGADGNATVRISADEFSGIAKLDPLAAQVATVGAAGSMWTSTSLTSQANELVYVGVVQGDAVTFSAGRVDSVAMVIGGQTSGTAGSIASEYALVSDSGMQAATIGMSPAATQVTDGVQATFVR